MMSSTTNSLNSDTVRPLQLLLCLPGTEAKRLLIRIKSHFNPWFIVIWAVVVVSCRKHNFCIFHSFNHLLLSSFYSCSGKLGIYWGICAKDLIAVHSVTRLIDCLFIFCRLQQSKFIQSHLKLTKVIWIFFPNTKFTLLQWAKFFNIMPEWLNFAKSGHTGRQCWMLIYNFRFVNFAAASLRRSPSNVCPTSSTSSQKPTTGTTEHEAGSSTDRK